MANSIPIVTTLRTPSRATSRGASDEAVNTDSVVGRNDSPACSASSPSTCWRYRVTKKNIENSAAYMQHDDQVGRAQRRQLEDRQRHQRRGRHPRLDVHERGEQCDGGGQRHQHPRRSPAERVGLNDPVGQADEARGDEHRAGDVEVAAAHLADVGGEHAQAEHHDEHADRHVDREDRRPAERLREDAAEQRARRRAEAADRAPQAKAAVALRTLGQRRGDDRQRGRREDGAAEALQCACADQQSARVRRARTPATTARTAQRRPGTRAGVRAGRRSGRRASESRRTSACRR